MSTIANTALTLAMLAAFLLTWGGFYAWRRQNDRKRGILMWIAAAVLVVNVAIWTV
jgi:LPXTG-motif cell wall-anchored protein